MTPPPRRTEPPREPADGVQKLAMAVPDGVAWIADGCIAWANDRLVEIAGLGTGLVGTKLEDLLDDLGDGLPGEAASETIECEIRRPAGGARTVVCRCAWRDAEDRTSAYVIQDVTRVRRLEQELLQAGQELSRVHRDLESLRERLRRESAEREELLGVVSHELCTPVTVIGGYNRLLLGEEVGPLNEQQRKFLEESNKSCQRLDAFIGNLLEASRADKGHEVLEVGRAPLAPVLHGVAAMFRPQLEGRDLRLSVELAAGAEEARFDRLRLEQVLINLVGNTVKFTSAGGSIEVAARAVDTPADEWVRRWVEISVSDDGPGIAPKDRERVFLPYVQLGHGRGGLGLGLAICRRLVEAHGGVIGLGERVGGGCRFSFTLPAEAPRRVSSGPERA